MIAVAIPTLNRRQLNASFYTASLLNISKQHGMSRLCATTGNFKDRFRPVTFSLKDERRPKVLADIPQ